MAPSSKLRMKHGPGSERPAEIAAGYQHWRSLLFLHWRVDPAVLRPLVPAELEIETYDSHAWVGVVPFAMDRVRPRWSPPVPGLSWFLETNVRTYVRRGGKDPGVWFFSLDANSRIAVAVARRLWHLNYHFARMRMRNDGGALSYVSSGRPSTGAGAYDIAAKIPLAAQLAVASKRAVASPGSLDHFLVERYLLYAQHPDGTLLSGRVHHPPYRITPVTDWRCNEQLTAASGIQPHGPCASVLYSPGVSVEVFPLRVHEG